MTTDLPTVSASTTASAVRQPWQAIARTLMFLVGASLLAGAMYFTFFASRQDGGVSSGFDWFVAVWALTVATGLLATAVLRGVGNVTWPSLATAVVSAHLVWGLAKLVAYDELVQSLTSIAVDAVILAVVWVGRRRTTVSSDLSRA